MDWVGAAAGNVSSETGVHCEGSNWDVLLGMGQGRCPDAEARGLGGWGVGLAIDTGARADDLYIQQGPCESDLANEDLASRDLANGT